MASVDQILARIDAAKRLFTARDGAMRDQLAIREGRFADVAPDHLPADFNHPMAANFIEVAGRAAAEALSPLPSFTCSNPTMSSDASRKSADKRTKIVNGHVQHSRLGEQFYHFADQYNSYGFSAMSVEADYDARMPCIYVEDVLDSMYANNRKGETVWFARRWRKTVMELMYEWEDYLSTWRGLLEDDVTDVELIRYWDKDGQYLLVPSVKLELLFIENPLDRCPIRVVERPHLGKLVRGAYDDLIGVQLARFLMAKYNLETAEQVAHAPLALPSDVQEAEIGPLSTLRSDTPQAIRRVDLSVPNTPFVEGQQLGQELQLGARHSELRDGATDANIITGKGVQALMAGFDQKTKVDQGLFALALADVASMCLEMDERLWPDKDKSVRAAEDGSPYEVRYRPSKDIKGDYNVDVSYGMTAGLDPNRALVFLLQLQSAGNLSRDSVLRKLPLDINVTSELQKIAQEQSRESLSMGIASLAQAIPAVAMQGGDPMPLIEKLTAYGNAIQKGASIEEAAAKAFAPAPPPPQAPSADPMAAAGGAAPPQDPLAALLGGGAPGAGGGMGAPGMPQGQDILQTLAGMGASGQPQLSASVRQQQPVA